MSFLNLNDFYACIEKLESELTEQYAGVCTGNQYSRAELERKSSEAASLYKKFLSLNSEPRSMYLLSAERIASIKTYILSIELDKKRNDAVKSRERYPNGEEVKWSNWMHFNRISDRSSQRKRVFDDFMEIAPSLSDSIADRFQCARNLLGDYGLDPLAIYLEVEKLDYDSIRRLLIRVGERAHDSLQIKADEYASKIWGKESFDYYDDFNAFAGRIYQDLTWNTQSIVVEQNAIESFDRLGFDLSPLDIIRHGGSGMTFGPAAIPVRIPTDIRVFIPNSGNPLQNYHSTLHEVGHGVHFNSIPIDIPYPERYGIRSSVMELFAMLFDSLLREPRYLKERLRLSDGIISDLRNRQRFVYALFLAFFSARALTKLEFWKDNLSIEMTTQKFEETMQSFYHSAFPGEYWLLDTMMTNRDLYLPSYIVAAVRVADLRARLSDCFQPDWWNSKEAGIYLRELMGSADGLDLSWSRLDPAEMFKREIDLPE